MLSNKESLQKLAETKNKSEKESLLDNAIKDIQSDTKKFFAQLSNWALSENKAFKRIEKDKRYTWKNHTENQIVQPLQYLTPKTYQELVDIIKTAEANKCQVRAVGSGHSFSDKHRRT